VATFLSVPRLLVAAALAVAVGMLVVRLEQRPGGGATAAAVLADPVRTPGVLNPAVTQANIHSTVCKRGWTATIRPPVEYTNALKREQMPLYGETGPMSDYQEDHLISLELGGNPTDPRNLWPEPYPRAAAVDQIENQLNSEVCSGALSLRDAQLKESTLKHTEG
jgi:hypothetical protein